LRAPPAACVCVEPAQEDPDSASRPDGPSDNWPSTTEPVGAVAGSYSTGGTTADAATDAADPPARRLPETDANSSPQDGHESRPFGTSAAHAPQTIDCAVIRYLVYAPTLPAGRRWLRLTDAPKGF